MNTNARRHAARAALAIVLAAGTLSTLPGAIGALRAQEEGTVAPGDKLDQMFGDAPEPPAAPDAPARAPQQQRAEAPPAPYGPMMGNPMGPMGGFAARPTSGPAVAVPMPSAQHVALPAARPPVPARNVAGASKALADMVRSKSPEARIAEAPAGLPYPVPAPAPMAGPGPSPVVGSTSPYAMRPSSTEKASAELDESADSDKKTAEEVVRTNRRVHILEARERAAKLQLALVKTQADIDKIKSDAEPPAPGPMAALPPAPMAALPSPIPSVAPVKPKVEPQVDVAKRFATISITGPQDRLQAMLKVKNFGFLTVHQGDSLPADYKVVAVQSKGVSVRKGSERPIMVPFVQ